MMASKGSPLSSANLRATRATIPGWATLPRKGTGAILKTGKKKVIIKRMQLEKRVG